MTVFLDRIFPAPRIRAGDQRRDIVPLGPQRLYHALREVGVAFADTLEIHTEIQPLPCERDVASVIEVR